jgi:Na+-transporting methylmalonyl-CoA/oxaloacetate decarboxylase gamma subunit
MHKSEENAIGCMQVLGMGVLLLFALLLIYEPVTTLIRWMRF